MSAIPSGGSFLRPTASSAASIGTVAFPSILLGAFAPTIKDDLGFGATGLGAVLTIGFFVSAVVLQFGGPFADLGPQRAVRLGLAVALVGTAAVALTARSWMLLVAGFAVARMAEGIVQPATNSLIAGTISPRRRGLAMGLKQSAVPVTTTLAGLAVPLLGSAIGWRGVFGLVAVLAVPAAIWVPFSPNPPPRTRTRVGMWDVADLRLAAVAGGFAAGAVVTVPGFLVTAAVDDGGFTNSQAGLLLTLGGVIMTVSRVVLGVLADRRSFNRFRLVALVLVGGMTAFPVFALGNKPAMIVGTALIFGIGWSFPGLFLLGIMETYPEAPGAATAVVQTGVRVGAMVAPLVFGMIVDTADFATAWMLPTVLMAVGAGLMYVVAERLAVDRPVAA